MHSGRAGGVVGTVVAASAREVVDARGGEGRPNGCWLGAQGGDGELSAPVRYQHLGEGASEFVG